MWKQFKNNPAGRSVGDCAVRALSVALDVDWETAYSMMVANGFLMADMPSSNSVWGAVLRQHGFSKKAIHEKYPDCYTFEDFARDNPHGTFVLGTGSHVATIKDGWLFDAWDSRDEIPVFVWYRKD